MESAGNLSLETIKNNKNYGLSISEAQEIPELVKQGLYAICICLLGEKRSPDAAFILNNFGYPSIYIIGGLQQISLLSEKSQKNLFKLIIEAPNVFITIDDFEQKQYENLLTHLKPQEGRVVFCKDVGEIMDKYVQV